MTTELEKLNLRSIPERFKEEGIYAHNQERVKVGDMVEAIRDVMDGKVPKGTKAKIVEIIVEPISNERGFSRKIRLEGFEGEYNPKRFKKI